MAVVKWFETNVSAWQHKFLCSHGSQCAISPYAAAMECAASHPHEMMSANILR